MKNKQRNPIAIPAKARKSAGKMKPQQDKRKNGKNKQSEYQEEVMVDKDFLDEIVEERQKNNSNFKELIRLASQARQDNQSDEDEVCLIAEFFRKEALKPANLRSNSCMISCRCKKCQTSMDTSSCVKT